MRKFGFSIGAVFTVCLASACDRSPCDQKGMLKTIYDDMKANGKIPNEYQLAEIKALPNGIYVGMSIKHSPTYRFHYLIDPSTCKVIDARYDQ